MQKFILASLVLAGATCAQASQIPQPAFGNTFTSTLTRGFWFQAPIGFTITGIEVYNEASQPNQVVEVINLGGSPPPAYPGTVTGTTLHYDNTTPSGTVAPMVVAVAPGDYIGILAACTSAPTSSTSYNSYATPSGPYATNLLGSPITLTRFGTQSGIASNGGGQPCWQEANGPIARADVYINTGGGNYATKLSFGTGCYDAASASFYESHTAFDLSNTSLQMTNVGTGYLALPGTNAVVPSTSTPVAMGDDQVLPFALGWTLPYPGGTTTDLYVSSNGFVNLTANTASGCCSFNLNTFLSNGPCFAAKWRDLNPSAGGSVYFDTDPVSGTATVTFDMVPDYGSSNQNTFQYYFDSAGNVELRFGAVAATAGGTGWSPGQSNRDPGSIDISAQSLILTAPDSTALSMDADARPIIGNTINLVLDHVPSGAPIAAILFGLNKFDPGIDLTGIGMPGCFQYGSQDAVLPTVSPGATITSPFVVPNNTSLAGVAIVVQGAAFAPGSIANALGSNSSNGLELNLDVN